MIGRPYATLVPKFTSEVAGWSVVQEMVAVVVVAALTITLEITGATAVVAKLEPADVDDPPELLAEVTSK
jgi:hypothetical protein